MPLFVLPGVIKFHFVILDYDFLGLQAVQNMATLETALEFAPHVIVAAPLVLRVRPFQRQYLKEPSEQRRKMMMGRRYWR